MNADSDVRFVILTVAASLLAFAAITVRRVGVSLIPPLVFMIGCSPQSDLLLKRLALRVKLVLVLVSLLVCAGTAHLVRKMSALSDFLGMAMSMKVSALILRILSYRLKELGELLGNVPLSRIPTRLHIVVPLLGFLLFALTLLGLSTKRRRIAPTEVFVVSYMGILFAWPYYDARFWLPVIPLLIAYCLLAVNELRFPKGVVAFYGVVFATLGFIAIAYSTRITFAGSTFPDRYGDGNLRATYCAAFQSCRDNGGSSRVDAKVLRLLQEYR